MTYLKELMSLGILIDPDANDRLSKMDDVQKNIIIGKSKEERPLVLTNEIIDLYLKTTTFKILKTFNPVKSFTVQDIVDTFNKRYDFIQNLLVRKIELTNIVSINKCSNGKVSVIGIVRNKERSNGNFILDLEDKTGSLKTVVSADIGEKIALDDIIAVQGNYNNKILFGEKAVYPDVPLRKVGVSEKDTKVVFVINHDFSKKLEIDADYIFIGNCDNADKAKEYYPRSKIFIVGDQVKEGIYYIQSPALIDVDGVTILILFNQDPLLALKKRFVNASNNDFLIDTIPDIIFTNKDVNANYKSISIVGTSTKIELKTRNQSNI